MKDTFKMAVSIEFLFRAMQRGRDSVNERGGRGKTDEEILELIDERDAQLRREQA